MEKLILNTDQPLLVRFRPNFKSKKKESDEILLFLKIDFFKTKEKKSLYKKFLKNKFCT